MSKNHQYFAGIMQVELSKFASTTKAQNHTFWKFL